MSQTVAHLVDHVIPHGPVRQWVLSLPIPLRLLLAAQPELVTPVLQVVQRVVTRHLLDGAQLAADEGHGGAVTLMRTLPPEAGVTEASDSETPEEALDAAYQTIRAGLVSELLGRVRAARPRF